MTDVNCRCFRFNDAGDHDNSCVCGHNLDEHDEFGECEAVFTVPNLTGDQGGAS